MNTALWIVTGLLAGVALLGGSTKTFLPKKTLAEHDDGRWTADRSVGFVKTLGILELGAAAGLIMPALLDVAPVIVPVTATCWVVLMIGAMITHLRLGQPGLLTLNFAPLAMAAFVAFGRFGPESFTG